ncbi:MAG: hypothetical protein BGO78_06220 [Chloroflexi bacterium 44-23]|nr:MAG: hypothetical protein BGO78_06220 [Chloroflexi bacterium 44-23]
MRDGLWNLLTILVFFIAGILIIGFGYMFLNPNSKLNPLSPPPLPEVLVLPSSTATLKQLPQLITPSRLPVTATESVTETLRPSSTPLPTNTAFVLPTATITSTPTATETETPTVTPTSEAYQCSVVSASPRMNQEYPPGGDFDGRWTLKNIGTESWDAGVDLVFMSGTRFQTGPDAFDLPQEVDVNNSVDMIVDMLAPRDAGTYESNWALRKGSIYFCNLRLVIKVK